MSGCIITYKQIKDMKMTDLNQKELELFNSLVRLGDSKELALKTVISGRDNKSNVAFYENAYCN